MNDNIKNFIDNLAKALNVTLYPLPIESFKNTVSTGHGIRVIIGSSKKAFRLNFDSANPSLSNISSVDLWNGTSHDPFAHIVIDGTITDVNAFGNTLSKLIAKPSIGTVVKVENSEVKEESFISEAEESGLELEVVKGGKGESYGSTPAEKALPNVEHIDFQKQLSHLRSLVVGIAKGASNALFVYGRGGTGKTTVVEKTLHDMGMSDGDGYFQISGGGVSPFVAYTTLYNNRNDIVLFDDSDSMLRTEEGRNLIKTATDTKKRRKLSWSRRNSVIFDPDKESPPEEELGIEKFPRYFDFEGRIIFISNLTLDELDPDGSIRTRAWLIKIDPTDDEMLSHMLEILDKIKLNDGLELDHETRMKVFNIVKSSPNKDDVNVRKLVRSMNFAATGIPGWEDLVHLYA
jgi:hypothetical protein